MSQARMGVPAPDARYRLLIVDDDPLNLDALARVLGDDYELVRAVDGEQALTILRDQAGQVDLILSDKAMPGMSGVKLLEEAKALHPEMMRIILTAYPDAADLAEAINRGEVYRYVTKPWSPDELRVVVAQALERYQLARDNGELIHELKRKNGELRVLATRVADAFLRRLDQLEPGLVESAGGRQAAVAQLLGCAAGPTVVSAAQRILRSLERIRRRASEARSENAYGADLVESFDIIARECIAEAQRIVMVVGEVDALAEPERPTPLPQNAPRAPSPLDDDD